MDAGMLSLAADFFNTAYDIAPDNLTLNKNLGLAYTKLSRYEDAMRHYNHILSLDENNGEVHGEMARLYMHAGDMKQALKHYRLAFKINPDDPRNIHGLVQLDARSITPEAINLIEKYLLRPDLPLDMRCSFYFALGAFYDARGKYDEAFANYSVANISKGVTFDAEKHTDFITDIIKTFTPNLFEDYTSFGLNNTAQPVFIVGMPRSGTTLVEQILASHSDIYAAGELNLVSDFAQKLNLSVDCEKDSPEFSVNAGSELLYDLSRFYINHINNLAHNDDHNNPSKITDKMPTNFLYLGLIARLFPKAKIIHCRRNALDVCLSCYFQNFSGDHAYTSDLNNIAYYYQQYERLMAYWEKTLPIEIYNIDYEEITTDLENTSKKLIEFVGLDWQSRCLEFYNTKRNVDTASLVQVRKKIYHSSVNRWQNYDKYLYHLKKIFSVFDYADEDSFSVIMKPRYKNYGDKSCNFLH
jgi:tetratricopeptide (TPR) repeat protein